MTREERLREAAKKFATKDGYTSKNGGPLEPTGETWIDPDLEYGFLAGAAFGRREALEERAFFMKFVRKAAQLYCSTNKESERLAEEARAYLAQGESK